MFYCPTLQNSEDFQSKIPKIFNFWSSECHQACLFGRVVTKINTVNFWNSKCHQSLLGNGRVVTKINAVNFNLVFPKNTANLHISRSFS